MLDRVSCRKTWQIYPPKSLVTVTLRSVSANAGSGTSTDYTVNKVREKKIRKSGEKLHDDQAAADQTVWQFFREMLDAAGAPEPMVGDFIAGPDAETGATQVWLVKGTVKQLFGTVINCTCDRFE